MTMIVHGGSRWGGQSPIIPSWFDADALAEQAAHCLILELETWPKPGLVSHVDRGSHTDMDAALFRASVDAIAPFLNDLCRAGARNAEMEELRAIGLAAEAAMFEATRGTNTHRGAIFGLGLLCAAAGARAAGRIAPQRSLGECVAELWGADIRDGPVLLRSHGAEMYRRYGTGGARLEAARGFPSVYRVGLPALDAAAAKRPDDAEAQRVEICFALIAAVDDTNLLHRGGPIGLAFARSAACRFLTGGGIAHADWRRQAAAIHRDFVRRRLSPGGAADLLAMTLFVDACERWRP